MAGVNNEFNFGYNVFLVLVKHLRIDESKHGKEWHITGSTGTQWYLEMRSAKNDPMDTCTWTKVGWAEHETRIKISPGKDLPIGEKWCQQKAQFRRKPQNDIFMENKMRECQDIKRRKRIFKYFSKSNHGKHSGKFTYPSTNLKLIVALNIIRQFVN